MRRLARNNPREVKRLLNSALMFGVGVERMGEANKAPRFAQGVQVYLISRVLHSFHGRRAVQLVSTANGQEFFQEWSELVREHPEAEPPEPQGLGGREEAPDGDEEGIGRERHWKRERSGGSVAFAETSGPYGELCRRWASELGVRRLVAILDDPDLLDLMKIPFSSEAASFMAAPTPAAAPTGAAAMPDVIAQAVAGRLRKPVDALTSDDYASTTELDLTDAKIADLTPLRAMTGLTELLLEGTQVSDLKPLAAMTALTVLSLAGTQVSDLKPLAALTALTTLDLWNTQVSDLKPLAALTGLTVLSLAGTQVGDFKTLAALTGLTVLFLQRTQVSDLKPLAALTGLTTLFLEGTQVSDLKPLAALTGLTTLDLMGTQVSDLKPLHKLTNLRHLHLHETNVSDEEVEALQKALPNVTIQRD